MTTDEFKACIVTYYQTEVLGEALFESLITKFQEPDYRYKIGSLLQLETETKARLRPAMLEDLRCRGYSAQTQQEYPKYVRKLAKHYMTAPDRLPMEQVQQYLDYLVKEKRCSYSFYKLSYSALKFFYTIICHSNIEF